MNGPGQKFFLRPKYWLKPSISPTMLFREHNSHHLPRKMSSSDSKIFSPAEQQHPHLNLHQAITNLQTHLNGFLHHHLLAAKNVLDAGFSRLSPSCPLPSNARNQVWARIGETVTTHFDLARQKPAPMLVEAIEERLGGIPVYALSNSNDEFVLVSGVSTRKKSKSLALLCFKEEDAAAILQQMKSIDPLMGQEEGSKVVAVALKKVVNLKVDGVAFRLVPETTQVKHALEALEKAGFQDDGFSGVPVFQSRSLVLQSQNRKYRPVFFRKEDLEKSLARASRQQNKLNPAFRQGDMQVAVFEDIIKGMKEGSTTWNDVIFIPPGLEVSTDPTRQQSA